MTWLVTGGAGYIGAHVVRAFQTQGLDAVVLDDLSSGHREFVPVDVPFVDGTVLDTDLLVRTLREHDVAGVVHVAGFKYAGVSVLAGCSRSSEPTLWHVDQVRLPAARRHPRHLAALSSLDDASHRLRSSAFEAPRLTTLASASTGSTRPRAR